MHALAGAEEGYGADEGGGGSHDFDGMLRVVFGRQEVLKQLDCMDEGALATINSWVLKVQDDKDNQAMVGGGACCGASLSLPLPPWGLTTTSSFNVCFG